jgi:pre-mRNA-splicing helicase BRR2
MIYEGIDEADREIVDELFQAGAIQILVCTYKMSWDLSQSSYCVMIMDTTRYDGQEKRYVDYTIPDMLQMVGKATTTKYSNSKCLVYW